MNHAFQLAHLQTLLEYLMIVMILGEQKWEVLGDGQAAGRGKRPNGGATSFS